MPPPGGRQLPTMLYSWTRLLYVSATNRMLPSGDTASECGRSNCVEPVPGPPKPSFRLVSVDDRCTIWLPLASAALVPVSATQSVPSGASATPCGALIPVLYVASSVPLVLTSSILLL